MASDWKSIPLETLCLHVFKRSHFKDFLIYSWRKIYLINFCPTFRQRDFINLSKKESIWKMGDPDQMNIQGAYNSYLFKFSH